MTGRVGQSLTSDQTPLVCERCYRLWQGTRPGTYMDELRQQDHKGPQDVLISNCCGRLASGWSGVRPVPLPLWKKAPNA